MTMWTKKEAKFALEPKNAEMVEKLVNRAYNDGLKDGMKFERSQYRKVKMRKVS